jgi:hypothetical protein
VKYKEIGLGLGRSVRLEKYNVIRPDVWLKVELGPDDDPDAVLEELKEDVKMILDELELEEAEAQGFVKDGKGRYNRIQQEED